MLYSTVISTWNQCPWVIFKSTCQYHIVSKIQITFIGRVPASGYRQDKQSFIANCYLAFLNSKLAAYGLETIRYSQNSVFGEFRSGSDKVDGYTSKSLYEIHG